MKVEEYFHKLESKKHMEKKEADRERRNAIMKAEVSGDLFERFVNNNPEAFVVWLLFAFGSPLFNIVSSILYFDGTIGDGLIVGMITLIITHIISLILYGVVLEKQAELMGIEDW